MVNCRFRCLSCGLDRGARRFSMARDRGGELDALGQTRRRRRRLDVNGSQVVGLCHLRLLPKIANVAGLRKAPLIVA
jgi:hypothetical protein